MISTLIFDFDGTLCELVEVHFQAFNNAIAEIAGAQFIITPSEQISVYNGLSTKHKLQLLIIDKGLPAHLIESISQLKQKHTINAINQLIHENHVLKKDLSQFKEEGYTLYCASNAVIETVILGLKRLGIYHLFDFVVGNNNLKRPKPAPDIYLQCFLQAGVDPKQCLIIEDSKHGRESALRSGAHVCTVDSEKDTTYQHIKKSLNTIQHRVEPWKDNKLKILIPAAGLGSRFKQTGKPQYQLPKPLIDVAGKPMLQRVVENLNIEAEYIFLVQEEHYFNYNLSILLPLMVPGCKIITTQGLTQGAACTALLAKEYINNNNHLLIANSDQLVGWSSSQFLWEMLSTQVDAGIVTFRDTNPKWSFARLGKDDLVAEVAEKKPISDIATVGIYWYRQGADFVTYAEEMIANNIRTNNEFYICPVFNQMIKAGKKIKTFDCQQMFGLGTPEDLEKYLQLP